MKPHFADSRIGYRKFSDWPDPSAAASRESKIRERGLIAASIDEAGCRTGRPAPLMLFADLVG
jgi:hypothetical protein